ncbi:MAG: hypothetical protein ABEJ92_00060 [Halobacteriales archaeon]
MEPQSIAPSDPDPAPVFDGRTRRRLAAAIVVIGALMAVGLGPWMFGWTRPLILGLPAWMWIEGALGLGIWATTAWVTRDLLGGGRRGD